jgi:hypothetical protein
MPNDSDERWLFQSTHDSPDYAFKGQDSGGQPIDQDPVPGGVGRRSDSPQKHKIYIVNEVKKPIGGYVLTRPEPAMPY